MKKDRGEKQSEPQLLSCQHPPLLCIQCRILIVWRLCIVTVTDLHSFNWICSIQLWNEAVNQISLLIHGYILYFIHSWSLKLKCKLLFKEKNYWESLQIDRHGYGLTRLFQFYCFHTCCNVQCAYVVVGLKIS